METVVTPYLKRIEDIDLEKVGKEIILNNKGEIINLLKFGQLADGLNSQGKIVGRYSLHTQGYANAQNIKTPKTFNNPFNFYWSGQTIENLDVKNITKKKYEILTVKRKQDILEEAYGEIFDLTKEHNDWVNENIILPNLQKHILEELFK